MKQGYRIALVILWGLMLLMLTCTTSLLDLLRSYQFQLTFVPLPDYTQLFNLDINGIHHRWIIVKLGHFAGFAMLDLLLFHALRRHKAAFLYSVLFALATEVAQLHFARDGRLYDVLIDSLGIIMAFGLLKLLPAIKSRWLLEGKGRRQEQLSPAGANG